MSVIDCIREALQANLAYEDGKPFDLESLLLPPLTIDEINAVEAKLGLPLPRELRELLTFCSGIRDTGYFQEFDFTGGGYRSGFEEAFPGGVEIGGDGYGNSWVLDLTPETTEFAPVFFACHDAPVLLYQSPDLSSFLTELFRVFTPPWKSLVNDVHDDKLFDVWSKNPGVIDQATAAQSEDSVMRSFAAELPDHFKIVDLRNVEPGMGFSWGRYGQWTEVRRRGDERIFAYGKRPPTGWLSWLFGK